MHRAALLALLAALQLSVGCRTTEPVEARSVSTGEEAPEPAYPNVNRRGGLSVGAAFLERFDTSLAVSSPTGVGGVLDMEELLGVDERSTVLRLDGFYAFDPRHRVDLSFYDVTRSGTESIAEDVQVGDVVIPAGGVSTGFDTQVIKAAYRYNFVHDGRAVIGISGGLHLIRVDFDIQSDLGPGISESVSAHLPLPVLGLHTEYALSPTWKLYLGTEVLQVELGSISGWIRDTRFGLDHDPFPNFGWGIGFNSFGLNGSFEDDDLKAEIDYGFQGAMIYLRSFF